MIVGTTVVECTGEILIAELKSNFILAFCQEVIDDFTIIYANPLI